MPDRIHVTVALELTVDDAAEMRKAAFERLRSAWSSDDDFPYESADDIPLDEVVHSMLAAALPAEMPGCRRSQLQVDVDVASGDDSQGSSRSDSEPGSDDTADGDGADDDADDSEGSDSDGHDASSEARPNDDSEGSDPDDDDSPEKMGSGTDSSNSA